ncbi:MAG: hydrogenase expression/formation protein HypE, partial [Firmicutes bacterium]|nr:hydrogenase expression/formation protein HypE [Bacillota bacterium]
MNKPDKILLAHGSGGSYYQQLVEEVFVPAFSNPVLSQLADAAVVAGGTEQLAMTTDSFVVRPRFFAGGDIGRLAVCGTVNDLAMSGATPRWLSCGMVLEAGLPIAELQRICASMAAAAAESGVAIICGDTKVVEAGAADGIYINTAG